MTGKVNEYSISAFDLRIADEMGHESVLDGLFGSLFVQKKACVLGRDFEAVDEPVADTESVGDASGKIRDFVRDVGVDAYNKSEDPRRHLTALFDWYSLAVCVGGTETHLRNIKNSPGREGRPKLVLVRLSAAAKTISSFWLRACVFRASCTTLKDERFMSGYT